jgi:hypothetical protein
MDSVTCGTTVAPNAWTHVAMTYDGSAVLGTAAGGGIGNNRTTPGKSGSTPPNSANAPVDPPSRLVRAQAGPVLDRSVETRLAVLESAKGEVQVWVAILIGVVVLLLAANVGMSVWQVGSMARKEVDENLREFDGRFRGVVDKNIGAITQAISVYESRLEALTRSVQEANGRTNSQIESIQKKTQEFSAAAAEVIAAIGQDAERVKTAALQDLRQYYEAQILDLAQKQARK